MTLVSDPSVLSPEMQALYAAVGALAEVTPAELPEAQALEDVRALVALREQVEVHLLARLRDMESRDLHQLDAYGSAARWVEGQGASVDGSTVALARKIVRYPAVSDAMEAGRLSVVLGRQVGRAVEKVRGFLDRPDGLIDGLPAAQVLRAVIVDGVSALVAEAWGGVADDDPRLAQLRGELTEIAAREDSEVARVEAAFVALARRVERGLVRPALMRLVDALLPVQLEEAAEDAIEGRGLSLVHHSDRPGGKLEADLDEECFELAHAALQAAMATDPDNVDDTAKAADRRAAESADGADALPAPRTMLQRRHDAFRSILRDFLGSGVAGTRGKVVPHIGIVVGIESLHGAPGALPAVSDSGARLSLSVVRRLLCDSAVTRFVLSLGHRVIETSHTVRTLKTHERRAKLVETGGRCQAASCHHPPGARLIPHHPDPYAVTGTTSFFDTVLLCEGGCHDDLHIGGKVLRLRDGRLLGPSGWVLELRAA